MSKHSKHTWVVDVIEDGSASIEVDGRSITPIPAWMLPEGAKEGDVLSVTHDRGDGKSELLIQRDAVVRNSASNASVEKPKKDRARDVQL